MIRSAGFLIVDKENCEILLIKNKAGHWDFPKGHIEEGENIKEAATRELQEETGIEISELEITDKTYYIEYFVRTGKNRIDKKRVDLFLAFMKKRPIKISHEHSTYRWVKLTEVENFIKYKEQLGVLNKLREELKC